MWSDKKYVNILINVLLFLVSVNFLHYGQLILPIICLILFIDNKFKFKINNIKTFILLCLFAITFCIFSYKLGFYCVMGFCFPMAYYIGSNLKQVNEENIKKIIYIITFGMSIHVVLNYAYDIYHDGFIEVFNEFGHRDIWTKDKVLATITTANYLFIIGCSYYLFRYEKNNIYRITALLLFIIMFIYNLGLGRRTPVLMIPITICFAFLLDLFVINRKSKFPKKKLIVMCIIMIIILILLLLCKYNFNLLVSLFGDSMFAQRFGWLQFDAERLDLMIEAMKLAPSHMWGRQEISAILDQYVHNLWFDVFDYAGIIPFILVLIYTVYSISLIYKFVVNKKVSNEFKMLILPLCLCIIIEMCLEPAMSGLSLILLCVVVINALLEKINYEHK